MAKWKTVNCNPQYLVSDNGHVRRKGDKNDHSTRNSKGYLVTDLYKDGKRVTRRVHRLVAEAFLENPKHKKEVNHKDGNKHNNRVENLEWVTKKENCHHAWANGLAKPSYGMRGKHNPNAGRHGKPFRVIETGDTFNTLQECEAKTNFNGAHINDCLKGRQKSHKGCHFKYL